MRPSVFDIRHMTSQNMKFFEFFFYIKTQGQRSNSRSMSNKGQGHLEICTILYVNQCDIVELMNNGNWLLKSSIFNRFFSKLTHILLGPIGCNLKKWIGPKNVTYVSMATKIPIIKNREFLNVSMCYISTINEHIASKLTPVVHSNKWWILKSQMTLNLKVKVKHIKNHENHLLSWNWKSYRLLVGSL